jgi:hypothetical protein
MVLPYVVECGWPGERTRAHLASGLHSATSASAAPPVLALALLFWGRFNSIPVRVMQQCPPAAWPDTAGARWDEILHCTNGRTMLTALLRFNRRNLATLVKSVCPFLLHICLVLSFSLALPAFAIQCQLPFLKHDRDLRLDQSKFTIPSQLEYNFACNNSF